MNSHSLQDVLKIIEGQSKAVILSKNKYFDQFKNCIKYEGDDEVPSCFVGREVACVFVDVDYTSQYSLELLHYILTRRRGSHLKTFPEQVYFISDINRNNNYTFYGEVKL